MNRSEFRLRALLVRETTGSRVGVSYRSVAIVASTSGVTQEGNHLIMEGFVLEQTTGQVAALYHSLCDEQESVKNQERADRGSREEEK